MRLSLVMISALVLLIGACSEKEDVFLDGNQPPDYKSIPTIKVENYVNRMFIDLLGREPIESERLEFTDFLKKYDLSMAARDTLIRKLIYDTTYHSGDSSYNHACFQRLYDLSKARFLEGADDGEFGERIGNLEFAITVARLNGDSIAVYSAMAEQNKFRNVISSRWKYRKGIISYSDMCALMLNNGIYDEINMNSFNYVNASFDDLFARKPITDEFNAAYDIIDKNIPKQIFNRWAANKNEYCDVLTHSSEFFESQIRWTYYVLLQRAPSTQEVINLFGNYSRTENLQEVRINIIKTDEYAQFRR